MSHPQQQLQPLPGLGVPAGRPRWAYFKGQRRKMLSVPYGTKANLFVSWQLGVEKTPPGCCPLHISAAWWASSSLRAPEEQVFRQEENTLSLAHTHPHSSLHACVHVHSYSDVHPPTYLISREIRTTSQSHFWGRRGLRVLVTKSSGPPCQVQDHPEHYSDVHVPCRPGPLQA